MNTDPLATIAGVAGVHRFPGISGGAVLSQGGGLIAALPAAHVEVLRSSNGVQLWNGYFRLFGIGVGSYRDAIEWNDEECWKFAWGHRARGFWCFGETAWGDQYAYKSEDLGRREAAPVYFLEAWSLTPVAIATSFEHFLDHEFFRVARMPYDEHLIRASERFGPIEGDSHLVYVPSVLLGGVESMDNLQLLPARAAMIIGGDIARQVDGASEEVQPTGVETFCDEWGRTRVRVLWT